MAKQAAAKGKGVDLGTLQAGFEQAQRNWQASERSLALAQELRDKNKAKYLALDQALRDASRTVLG